MTEISTNVQHGMNASCFMSRLAQESPANATMSPPVHETPSHRRRHRRQNAQFFGFFEDVKDIYAAAESLPATTSNTASIVNSRPNLRGGDDTDTSMAVLDNNSSHLMQLRFAQRYLTNAPVSSPYSNVRHTRSFDSSNDEDGDDDFSAQGVTQLSQMYANGRYKKQQGEFITEDYYFRSDEGKWNHLEWHSGQ
jgi:hypothetical protein